MALWILSGTNWVSRYQKKHSPTHTYRGHQSSLIWFLHLLQSMASFVFNLHACDSLFHNLSPSFLWFTKHLFNVNQAPGYWQSDLYTVVIVSWRVCLLNYVTQQPERQTDRQTDRPHYVKTFLAVACICVNQRESCTWALRPWCGHNGHRVPERVPAALHDPVHTLACEMMCQLGSVGMTTAGASNNTCHWIHSVWH